MDNKPKPISSINNSIQSSENRNLQQKQDGNSQSPSTASSIVPIAKTDNTENITDPIYTREATIVPLQDNTPETRQEIYNDITQLIELCSNLKNKEGKTKILMELGLYFAYIDNIKNKYVKDTKIAEALSTLWEDITYINADDINISLLHDMVDKSINQLQTLATFYQKNPKPRNIVVRFFIGVKQIFTDCLNFIKSLINREKNIILSEDDKNKIRRILQSGSATLNTSEDDKNKIRRILQGGSATLNTSESQAVSSNNTNTELEVYISNRKILLSYEEEKYLQDIIKQQNSTINIEQLKTTSIAEYKEKLATCFAITAIDNENNQHIKAIHQKLDQANIENPAHQRINQDVPKNLSNGISIAPLNNFSGSCWFNSSITLLHHIVSTDNLDIALTEYSKKISLISKQLTPYAYDTYSAFINLNKTLTSKDNELVIDELQDFLTKLAIFAKKVSTTNKTLFKDHEGFYDAASNIFNIFSTAIDENYRVDINAIDQYGVVEFINHIFQFLDFKSTTNSLNIVTEEQFTIDANSLKTAFSTLHIPLEIKENIVTVHTSINSSTTACPINLFHSTSEEEKNATTADKVNFNLTFINEYIKKQVTVTSDASKLKYISNCIEKSQQLNQQLCKTTEVAVQKESLTFLQSDNIQELKNFIIDVSNDTVFNTKFPEITTIVHDAKTNKKFSVTARAKNFIVFSGSTDGAYYGHYSSFSVVDDFKDIIVHDDAFQGTLNQFYRTRNTDKSAEFMAEFEKKDLATRLDILMKETGKTPVSALYEVTSFKEA